MNFTCSVIINKPKEKVVEIFKDEKNLGEYQEGFLRKILISGKVGEVNTVSRMYYKMGKGEMELTETILKNDLPDVFLAQYHHKHTDNTMRNSFMQIDENTTQYNAEINYTNFNGFMIKIMKSLFPSMFKKQVQKWLNNFKIFVEKQ